MAHSPFCLFSQKGGSFMASTRIDQANRLLFHAVCSPYMENVISAGHQIFQRPVAFLDEYFHLVNMSPEQPLGIPLWDTLYQKKAIAEDEKEQLLAQLTNEEAQTFCMDGSPFRGLLSPILMDRRNRGYLLCFWDSGAPSPEDLRLMDMLLQAVTVRASTRTRTIGSWSISLSEKLSELLDPDCDDHIQALAAQAMEDSLPTMYAVCAVPMGPLPAQRAFAQEAVQQLQQQLHNVVCFIYQDAIVLLCSGLPTIGQEPDIRESYLMRRLTEFFRQKDMILGISDRFHMLSTTREHYRQALLSANMAARMGLEGAASFSQLMPMPLFWPLVENHDVEAFIPPELMKIRAHDRIHGTNFMETLEVYSLMLFHKKEVAKALHIHVNTLSYRLAQIEELFGIGSQTMRDQLRLVCSFLILHLTDRLTPPKEP